MNIPTASLRKFQKMSSHVKGHGILPIYKYIKFGDGKISKNINSCFVQLECKEAEDDLAVLEDDLYALLNVTEAPFINISKKKDQIVFSDGRDKPQCPFDPTAIPIEIPNFDSKKIPISGNLLDGILKAANFADSNTKEETYYNYIHVGKNAVCAGDGIICYYRPIEESMEMVLDKKWAQLIAKQDVVDFSFNDRYNVFYTEDGVFGFGKTVIGLVDFKKLFQHSAELSFSISKSELQSFNSLAIGMVESPGITISTGRLTMYDNVFGKENEREVGGLVVDEPFNYNPFKMNILLDALGVEELDFYDTGGNLYYVQGKGQEEKALIAKIQKH